MIYPTRIDHSIMGGATKTIEFTLSGIGSLENDTVDLYLSRGSNKAWHLRKRSLPGAHYDAVNRKVRFTLNAPGDLADVPATTIMEVWWYEVWRTDGDGKIFPHGVGELQVLPTNRS